MNILIFLFILFSSNLRGVPCNYLMPGQILETYSDSAGRVCITNTSKDSKTSQVVIVTFISYYDNSIHRFVYTTLTWCSMSKVVVFSNGQKQEFMVDTLKSGWIKTLYNNSCSQ